MFVCYQTYQKHVNGDKNGSRNDQFGPIYHESESKEDDR